MVGSDINQTVRRFPVVVVAYVVLDDLFHIIEIFQVEVDEQLLLDPSIQRLVDREHVITSIYDQNSMRKASKQLKRATIKS